MIGPDLYSFRALWRHYRNCRRNKRNTFNALAFKVNAEAKLLALQEELGSRGLHLQRRGVCPSRGARRMAETAAHLVDHVIPRVPVRQWVFSFPIPLRLLFATHPKLLALVLQIARIRAPRTDELPEKSPILDRRLAHLTIHKSISYSSSQRRAFESLIPMRDRLLKFYTSAGQVV